MVCLHPATTHTSVKPKKSRLVLHLIRQGVASGNGMPAPCPTTLKKTVETGNQLDLTLNLRWTQSLTGKPTMFSGKQKCILISERGGEACVQHAFAEPACIQTACSRRCTAKHAATVSTSFSTKVLADKVRPRHKCFYSLQQCHDK